MKIKNKLYIVLFLMVVAVVVMVTMMTINDVSGETEQMRGDGWMKQDSVKDYLDN